MKKNIILMTALFHAALPLSAAGPGTPALQLLDESGTGVTMAFYPEALPDRPVTIDGKSYVSLQYKDCHMSGETGSPAVPGRVVLVVLPPEGGFTVSVIRSEFADETGRRLVPAPGIRSQDPIPANTYIEGPSYDRTGLYPPRIFEAGTPGWSGGQRILRIRLFPVQFDPATNLIRRYSAIELKVAFETPFPQAGQEPPAVRSGTGKDLFINPGRAYSLPAARIRRPVSKTALFESGSWYKIPVARGREGIFRITGAFLNDHGVDPSAIDPSTLKIFNNGGRMLPRNIDADRPDGLIETPIQVVGMEDGRFDESDYILFYGRGVTGWEYDNARQRLSHFINLYTETNIYWLVFNDGTEGKRIPAQEPESGSVEQARDRATDYGFIENDLHNIFNGGLYWWGYQFIGSGDKSYSIPVPDPSNGESLTLLLNMRGGTSNQHQFTVTWNGAPIGGFQFSGAREWLQEITITDIQDGSNSLRLGYTGSSSVSQAYVDWIEWEYTRNLNPDEGSLRFFAAPGAGRITYRLSNFDDTPRVWEISGPENITQMTLQSVAGGWIFTHTADEGGIGEYLAVTPDQWITPETIEPDTPSSLRSSANSADMVIITHTDFYDQALRLESMRESHDSLDVMVARIQDIYDEFSGGLLDPVAIRDFLAHTKRTWSRAPGYVLLLGDGDYDYRNRLSQNDKNWIPPYEQDGFGDSGGRATDDGFTYVTGSDTEMDLAIGRLPAQTPEEAEIMVSKIIQYETDPDFGEWRNLVTLVGDDEKGQYGTENELRHTSASEQVSLFYLPRRFNQRKIYLMEYEEEILEGARRKPRARQDLINQINEGTLLVNYIGHGNEEVWAHEWAFHRDTDLPSLTNSRRLPLFYAATCRFGKYDSPFEQSFTEELLRSPGKGGVAVISASRDCNANSNEALNQEFLSDMFPDWGAAKRLGDALRAAKLSTWDTANNEMYHLFGDPAMRLGAPRHRAVIQKIMPDTLKALSLVQIDGEILNAANSWPGYQGLLYTRVFDATKKASYKTISYTLPGNALFRGESETDNVFQVKFIVPKDIQYGGETGRMSVYFNNSSTDGAGYMDGLKIGGSASLVDTEGPLIDIAFNEMETFVSGGPVPENPELVVRIHDDKTGINITGEIGHKIVMTLNGDLREDLTHLFQYDEGSYLGGTLTYPLTNLSLGNHELEIKAWDNANNSSTRFIMFRIVAAGELRIDQVMNYPNPFDYTSGTHITFHLSHSADITVKIYTIDGRMIRRIDHLWSEAGFNMIQWDGRDEAGDELANGVYLYRISAAAQVDGHHMDQAVIGRAMIQR